MIFAEPMPAIERWRIHARLDYFLTPQPRGDLRGIGGLLTKYQLIDSGRAHPGPHPWKEPGSVR